MSPSEMPGMDRVPRAVDYSAKNHRENAQTTQQAVDTEKAPPAAHTDIALGFAGAQLNRQNDALATLRTRLKPVLLQHEEDGHVAAAPLGTIRNPGRSSAPIAAGIHSLAIQVQDHTDILESLIRDLTI